MPVQVLGDQVPELELEREFPARVMPAAEDRAVDRDLVVPELGELASFVRANLGLKSVGRAKVWGDQLNAWAEMLPRPQNSVSSVRSMLVWNKPEHHV